MPIDIVIHSLNIWGAGWAFLCYLGVLRKLPKSEEDFTTAFIFLVGITLINITTTVMEYTT